MTFKILCAVIVLIFIGLGVLFHFYHHERWMQLLLAFVAGITATLAWVTWYLNKCLNI